MATSNAHAQAVTAQSDAARALERQAEVHVVAHTHWDREWYQPAERFRQRLVALVDALLDHSDHLPFLLDGQAIVIEDYLTVRPDRADALIEQLQFGRIEAGPWYVLADNLIPSGEAIVRNLQAGRRILGDLFVQIPAVAYCPDSFGHPANMPQIAAGFGLRTALVWRGFGGPEHPPTDTFWWQAADGSRIIGWHLPRDGYEFGSALPVDPDAAKARFGRIDRHLLQRAATSVVLLPNGADHHALQPDLTRAIDLLNNAAVAEGREVRFTRSMLGTFTGALEDAVAGVALPIVHGELRNSYGYTWTLQGTLATRAADKRRNAKLERLLLHDVEPWCALAMLRRQVGGTLSNGTVGRSQLSPLLVHAWKTLLRTHPHDTLCGCSIDDVAFAMRGRQRSVARQGTGLRDDTLALLLDHDVVSARSAAIDRDRLGPIVVRNRAARTRSGVARVRLIETISDVAVGPGSAPVRAVESTASHAAPPAVRGLHTQPLTTRTEHLRRESPQHYPDNDQVRIHDMLSWVSDVPALGLRVVDPGIDRDAALPTQPVTVESVGDALQLANGIASVRVSMQGATLQVGDRIISDLVSIESTRDVGDSYTPSLRGDPVRFELTGIRRGLAGPLRGSIELRYIHPDGGVHARIILSLDANSPHPAISVRGRNARLDHRLRLHVRTHIGQPTVFADAAFGPVQRAPIVVDARVAAMETPLPTMPLHRWVSVSDAHGGVAVISDGLAEAEAGEGFVAVTMLRAIDQLSRNDLPERPGHAGWPADIPDAQSLGRFAARFAVVMHEAWSARTIDVIEQAADDVLLPLTAESWRDLAGSERTVQGIEVSGTALRCQAFMPAQDGIGSVVRVVNLSDAYADGRITLPDADLDYCLAALNEMPTSEWQPAHAELPITVPPRGALTLRLRARP